MTVNRSKVICIAMAVLVLVVGIRWLRISNGEPKDEKPRLTYNPQMNADERGLGSGNQKVTWQNGLHLADEATDRSFSFGTSSICGIG